MSELRQNIATKVWFIIATERAKRPTDFSKMERVREHMEYSPKCPFCPGNEDQTTPPTYEILDEGKWFIRSVPNKFSALQPEGDRKRENIGIYRKMNGFGYHEVIIESPLHDDHLYKMSTDHIQKIIECYLSRYKAIISDERIENIIIFKNYGPSAGSSLAHPHSQLIATPIVPTSLRSILNSAKEYCEDTGDCAYCVMLAEELASNERIIYTNDSFIVFCPYASGSPFETWIVPRRHAPSFSDINQTEAKDLAYAMKDLFSRLYCGLNDPDFNYVIKTPPRDESNDRCYHWYVQVLPKISHLAGFELGTGMLINSTIPELNAEFLRNVEIGAKD